MLMHRSHHPPPPLSLSLPRTSLSEQYAMGDVDLPEDATLVQDFKKMHGKKTDTVVQRIETRVQKERKRSGLAGRKLSFRKNAPGRLSVLGRPRGGSGSSTASQGADGPVVRRSLSGEDGGAASDMGEFGADEFKASDQYSFSHVVAVTMVQSVVRGVRARAMLQQWKRMAQRAGVRTDLHPMLRTRHMVCEENFVKLQKGISGIHTRMALKKVADRARTKVAGRRLEQEFGGDEEAYRLAVEEEQRQAKSKRHSRPGKLHRKLSFRRR